MSRSASPIRLRPRTVRKMPRPGKTASHQACVHIGAAVREHAPIGRDLRGDADAEEAEARFRQDGRRHREGRDDDRRPDQVRQNVPRENPCRAAAHDARRGDILHVTQRERLRARDARVRIQRCSDSARITLGSDWPKKVRTVIQQDGREGPHGLDEFLNHRVAAACDEARIGAEQQADAARNKHDRGRDRERHARARHHACEDVTPQLIGAERIVCVEEIGRLQGRHQVLLERPVTRDEAAQRRERDDQQETRRAENELVIAAQAHHAAPCSRMRGSIQT